MEKITLPLPRLTYQRFPASGGSNTAGDSAGSYRPIVTLIAGRIVEWHKHTKQSLSSKLQSIKQELEGIMGTEGT